MPALDHIEVRGFKSIREMSLDLRALNVLIGANGSGKSNFIAIFRLLNELVRGRLQSFVTGEGGASSLLYFGPKSTQEIAISLRFANKAYSAKLASTAEDSLFFLKENVAHSPLVEDHEVFDSGHRESKLVELAHRNPDTDDTSETFDREFAALSMLDTILGWKVYHFHDTSREARIKQTGDINDNVVLRSDASNLAAFLYLLQQRYIDNYNQIVKTVRLVAPFFDDFILRPNALNPDTIQLRWREKGSDMDFNANVFSDGTLRFICLATLLLQPKLPSTILIDEPELGLHPYAITLLAGILRSVSTQSQVIVSTQSVPLVNQFAPEDTIVVDREDNQSVFRRLQSQDLEHWLEDYGLGELWEKNIIGGRPR